MDVFISFIFLFYKCLSKEFENHVDGNYVKVTSLISSIIVNKTQAKDIYNYL